VSLRDIRKSESLLRKTENGDKAAIFCLFVIASDKQEGVLLHPDPFASQAVTGVIEHSDITDLD
jgi:hypothetical protein